VAEWIEVWGKKPTETEIVLVYKFPVGQWTEDFRQEFLLTMSKQGIKDVEIRHVRDGKAGGVPVIPTWLYDGNGNQLFYVYVPASLPPVVTCVGRVFRWESTRQRYEETVQPLPCFLVPSGEEKK
jgi:hypothetical protein